jgi:broad specificity phosphatase PhoE
VTRLLLLRHAESEWNAQRRWQGMADPPLSPHGRQQAAEAGELLRSFGFPAIVSSDLRRAMATAAIIADICGLDSHLSIDRDLREYDVGAWSGLTRAEIEAEWPGAVEDWRQGRLAATPGGERRDSFIARVTAAAKRVATNRPGDTALVITHGGVIGALAHSLGAPPTRVAHLAGRWFDVGPDGLRAGTEVVLLASDAGGVAGDESTDLSPSAVLDTGGR